MVGGEGCFFAFGYFAADVFLLDRRMFLISSIGFCAFVFFYIWVKGAFSDSRPPFAEYRSNFYCYLEDIFLIADRKDYLFFMGIKRSFSFQ